VSVRICGKLITTVIAECFNNTFHLLDRFHVVDHLNKAVDNVGRRWGQKAQSSRRLHLKNVAEFF